MEQALQQQDAAAGPWTRLYGPVAAELAAAEALLSDELRSADAFIDSLVKHAFRLGGKRLRPALLLLAAQATGDVAEAHIVLAAVVEMIHTATLVHDDVLDEARLRRHRETINARNDNEASVLVGDYLFTHAFFLASSLETTFACQEIGRATNIVCAGELRQIHSRGNFALSEAEYIEIISAKTAELCACCCRLGAHYAGATPELEESLESFGRNLGIAFQIADDALDLVGDERSMGKSLGTDLEKQKPTLPLIRLLAKSLPEERRELVALLSAPREKSRPQVDLLLQGSDALRYASDKARSYARAARADLDALAPSPAREVLMTLTELVVDRQD
ncbi:MAG TPA: polyprenyl synthetase family protein [Pirellulales bacterium]|jgi:octaprenyl-diphosphate synthase|nr:polyprenyl synthetase family protein [Pirellulales bacterium]